MGGGYTSPVQRAPAQHAQACKLCLAAPYDQHHTNLCKQESMAFIAPLVGPGAIGAEIWRTALHPRLVPTWWSQQQQQKQERLSCTPAHEQRTTFATRPSPKSSTMASDQGDNIGAAGVHTPPRRRSLGHEVVAPSSGAAPAGRGGLVCYEVGCSLLSSSGELRYVVHHWRLETLSPLPLCSLWATRLW